MKTISNDYKNVVKKLGRQLDSKITYELNNEVIELGKEDLNSITPHYEGAILKSVMKHLDIDSNVDIPLNTTLNYQFGVKVNGVYEYINYGNYVVYSSEKQEDTNSYLIKCYDKMLYSMVDYTALNITYPITIRDYISAICSHLGLTFKNASDTFANYDKLIKNELYLDTNGNSLGYTFRDVLDELAQATASTICLDENDRVEIRYINDTEDTIDEEFFKDINVNFGEKYGPVNSIVLSRSAGTDNVYLQDEESIDENGLCEIKISDNQIMNDNDRSDFLPDILEELDGLEYYLNDYSSTGITFYELCDRYNVSIKNNIYTCIMFNDEVDITQGLEELVHTNMPEQTETDYKKADKTDRKINRTELIVDKQQGEIDALAQKIVDVSNTTTGTDEITLENAYEGPIHQIKIVGQLSLIFPNDSEKSGIVPYNNLYYPSNNLFPKKYKLVVDNETIYDIDLDFLNYINAQIHDEWVYEEGKQYIIRRVGIDQEGERYPLDQEIIEQLKDMDEILIKEDSNIEILPNEGNTLEATYLLQNEYTSTFATKYEVTAEINIKAGEIEQKVSGVADEDGNVTSASIILAINNDESSAVINADKIELNGNDVINAIAGNEINLTSKNINITSNNFSVDSSGNLSCTNANVSGDVTSNNVNITGGTIDITTTLGNVTIGKGTSGLIAMNGTYQSNYFDGIYNVGGMYYRMNGTYRFRVASASNSPYISLYNSSGYETVKAETLNSSGYLTVNNSSGTTTIDLVGSTGVVSCVRVVQTSQEKNKKNFELYDNALEEVLKTDIYKYNLFNEEDGDKKHVGFVIGENRNYSHDITAVDEEGKEIGVDDYSMISVLWKAVQEQQKQIEELKNKIDKLEGNDI